ncbi:DUF6790 family protein [Flavihumibacter petaseus]|uniref:Uncharacterized protein n=1 Tax=Flavihumibacter petaseus NBRC 106054 TaxID=1220578 RepID=A0A0E9N1B3_9BACT|nr:DUF6790 family protein [Flavihumibacter petaseus]GAO43140.1 hypothetical protein FPE01S_02_02440 [Flavihumibacter petaseus NBRC 106054]
MNKTYLVSLLLLILVVPVTGTFLELSRREIPFTVELFGKWFIFSAAGLRLFIAGLRQSLQPSFTAHKIFHFTGTDSYAVIRELGFANICLGLMGIISISRPDWRMPAAFASGLYYGLAGLLHIIKKPTGINEAVAMWTDLIIFALLAACFLSMTLPGSSYICMPTTFPYETDAFPISAHLSFFLWLQRHPGSRSSCI